LALHHKKQFHYLHIFSFNGFYICFELVDDKLNQKDVRGKQVIQIWDLIDESQDQLHSTSRELK
jgi:hypothetical protein